MHHLEPLSWDADSASGPFIACQRRALTSDARPRSEDSVREQLEDARSAFATRAIFRLILAFRRGVEQSVAPTSLAAITHATLELARLEFALLQWEPWCGSRFHSDCNHCIAVLEDLVVALSGDQVLPAFEPIHAMDTLIALLVQANGHRPVTGHIPS